MKPPTRRATFRLALRTWQASEAKSAPPSLINAASQAIIEVEVETTRLQQTVTARAKAALSALEAGNHDEARAALQRMADETG
jgi:hypothetical protein